MKSIRPLALALLAFIVCCNFAAAQVPSSKHVYIIAEENHSYQHLVGSPDMPYLNSLINQNGLATQFYADQHSSLPDYFWVTAGQSITEDNETTLTFDVDNIVRRAMQLGLSYKAYAQSLPSTGYTGVYGTDTNSQYYLKRHVPFPYFTDMGNSATELQKLVSTDQLLTDIQSGNLPNLAFITPDSHNDMHDCPTSTYTEAQCEQVADQFLQTYIKPLLARPEFQPGGDVILFIWSDEADLDTDNACSATVSDGCGGHVLVAVVGPKVKSGFQSTTTYHHESVLRTLLEAMGVTSNFPGAANTAPDMAEFFTSTVQAPPQQLVIASPANGTTISGQMQVTASAQSPVGVAAMQIYIDHNLTYTVNGANINTTQSLTPGAHLVVVKAWDNSGNPFSQQINVNEAAAAAAVTVSSPSDGATVSSPVQVVANGTSPAGVAAMQIYADHQLVYNVNSSIINTSLPLSSGSHYLVIKMWDGNGNPTSKALTINVSAPTSGINVVAPTAGQTVSSPVDVVATGTSPAGVAAMQIYSDDQLVYSVNGANLNTLLPLSTGSHNLVIKMWDNNGNPTSKSISIKVTAPTAGVTLTSPTTGSTAGSPVEVVASANSGNSSDPIGAMRIYVDDNSVYTVQSASINTAVTMSSGSHHVVVVAWDQIGNSWTKDATINVQ
jgi:acid phosphatase